MVELTKTIQHVLIVFIRDVICLYFLHHAVTKTQKVILDAFGNEADHVKYKVNFMSDALKENS